jgi:hypothetical protein
VITRQRYQVFISSTLSDLKDERRAVQDAILRLGHFPIGMELFPAASDSAWKVIEKVIGDSDYYVVIIGGRYGSVDREGVSYTEREYDLAVSLNKPVLAFMHENPASLRVDQTDQSESGWTKLKEFRSKVESQHHRNTWRDAAGLNASIIQSLLEETTNNPQRGWVRAESPSREELLIRLADLQSRHDQAVAERDALASSAAALSGEAVSAEQLDEKIALSIRGYDHSFSKELTIRAVFLEIADIIVVPVRSSKLEERLLTWLRKSILEDMNPIAGSLTERAKSAMDSRLEDLTIATVAAELRRLGLVEIDTVQVSLPYQRTVGAGRYGPVQESELLGIDTVWKLTERGLLLLRSIRRHRVGS